jgi:hypothetical protein
MECGHYYYYYHGLDYTIKVLYTITYTAATFTATTWARVDSQMRGLEAKREATNHGRRHHAPTCTSPRLSSPSLIFSPSIHTHTHTQVPSSLFKLSIGKVVDRRALLAPGL